MSSHDDTSPVPPEGGWRDDGMFLEFSAYGQTDGLDDPRSSGFNLIGGGGKLPVEEADDEEVEAGETAEERDDRAVIFYI